MANKTQEVIDRAVASVGAMTSVAGGAVSLLDQLSQLVRDNLEDPAALTDALDQIDARRDELAAAIARNTPAAPAPEPTA